MTILLPDLVIMSSTILGGNIIDSELIEREDFGDQVTVTNVRMPSLARITQSFH